MTEPEIWETPATVAFHVDDKECRAAQLGPQLWAVNMGVCMVTFDEAPPVELEQVESDRCRVVLGNIWFDTDDLAARKIANLMRGEAHE